MSEIILKGRQVLDVRVLERIAGGFSISRARLGVSYGEQEPVTPPVNKEMREAMKRRVLVGAIMAAATHQAAEALGEPIQLPLPTGEALPAQLTMSHVHIVRAVSERLRGIARYHGGQAGLYSAAAALYIRWIKVPAAAEVHAQLGAALAELHTEAGWCCHDDGVDGGGGHFTRAVRFADECGDGRGIVNAAWHARLTLVHSGLPNDALKHFQLGQLGLHRFVPGKSLGAGDDSWVPILTARLRRNSASAYAAMGGVNEATRRLAEANDGDPPREAFERASADLDTARVQRDLGQLDAAARSAASAVRTYREGRYRRGDTVA